MSYSSFFRRVSERFLHRQSELKTYPVYFIYFTKTQGFDVNKSVHKKIRTSKVYNHVLILFI